MINFAQQSDIQGYLGTTGAVPTIDPLNFRFATLLVLEATRRTVYPTNPANGLPTRPRERDAFRDAVCAQVLAWDGAGVDPTAGNAGVKSNLSSISLGGASRSYAISSSVDDSRASLADGRTLSRLAALELAAAGLLSSVVQSTPYRHPAARPRDEWDGPVEATPEENLWDPSYPDPSLTFENGLS